MDLPHLRSALLHGLKRGHVGGGRLERHDLLLQGHPRALDLLHLLLVQLLALEAKDGACATRKPPQDRAAGVRPAQRRGTGAQSDHTSLVLHMRLPLGHFELLMDFDVDVLLAGASMRPQVSAPASRSRPDRRAPLLQRVQRSSQATDRLCCRLGVRTLRRGLASAKKVHRGWESGAG